MRSLPGAGTYSLWAGPLDGPPVLTHQAQARHYAASTMKLPLMVAAYREADAGRLDLDTRVTVHADFTSQTGGRFTMDRDEDSDPEPWNRVGTDVALRWLVLRSIVLSSNLATNLVLEAVGVAPVQAALAATDATNSRVERGIEDAAAREAGLDNLVTAEDLAKMLQAVANRRAAGDSSCTEMLAVLAAQQLRDRIPVGLPPGTKVAHKTGWVEGIGHDAGIIYPSADDEPPYVFVMCTTSHLSESDACALIGRGAAASWQDRHVLAQPANPVS